jgi:hypothetical protein
LQDMRSPTQEIPVLLTSSVIAHDTDVLLKNKDERIRLTLQSVERWLRIDPDISIVICDGSSFDFSRLIAEKFPNTKIECLYFENDQGLVKKYGRGYGEGEIIRHALNHSKSIIASGCFAKCTSKLWVENFKKCAQYWNGRFLCKGVFINVFSFFKKTELSYIDTRFYIVSNTFYRQHFENAHFQIDRAVGHGLENCFHDIVLRDDIRKSLFNVVPIICGVGGGIGTYYKNSLKRRLKEIIRLDIVRMNESFTDLFI